MFGTIYKRVHRASRRTHMQLPVGGDKWHGVQLTRKSSSVQLEKGRAAASDEGHCRQCCDGALFTGVNKEGGCALPVNNTQPHRYVTNRFCREQEMKNYSSCCRE